MASKGKIDRYPNVQEVEVTARKPSKVEQWSDDYTKWQQENPGKKLAADMTPYVGSATGVADTLNDAYRGDYGKLPLDVVGIIPGVRYITRGAKAAKAARAAGNSAVDAVRNLAPESNIIRANEKAARGLDNAQDVYQAKSATGHARGGRIDGIAKRGKTKGRMR